MTKKKIITYVILSWFSFLRKFFQLNLWHTLQNNWEDKWESAQIFSIKIFCHFFWKYFFNVHKQPFSLLENQKKGLGSEFIFIFWPDFDVGQESKFNQNKNMNFSGHSSFFWFQVIVSDCLPHFQKYFSSYFRNKE